MIKHVLFVKIKLRFVTKEILLFRKCMRKIATCVLIHRIYMSFNQEYQDIEILQST